MRLVLALLVGGLLALPAATALPEGVLYWLKDRPTGITDDGLLVPYLPAHPNVPNGTVTKLRYVTAASDLEPVQFVQDERHADRLRGPLFAAIWPGPSSLLHGNLTISIYELPAQTVALPDVPTAPNPVPPAPCPLPDPIPPGVCAPSVLPNQVGVGASDPFLPSPAGNPPKLLLTRTHALDANLSHLPDPTTLVPAPPGVPPPTDPTQLEGYVLTTAFIELYKVYPYVTTPFIPVNFGFVDLAVNKTSRLAIGFTLDQGSSPAPLPEGAFASVAYDTYNPLTLSIAPSYLYLPWYNTTAPAKSGSAQPTHTGAQPTYPDYSGGGNGQGGGQCYGYCSSSSSSDGGKKSPDAGLLLLPAIGLLAYALRRRVVH